jgi:hypothetical protein
MILLVLLFRMHADRGVTAAQAPPPCQGALSVQIVDNAAPDETFS